YQKIVFARSKTMFSSVLKAMVLFGVLTFAASQPGDGLAAHVWQQNPQHVAQQEVNCPVESVRTEITTKLPDPWWKTTQVGKLEGVSFEVIGGKKTLVCRYWAYGVKVAVMRLYPEGVHECDVSGNHFVCQ